MATELEKKAKKYVITKKIAKHGSQSIIVIPRVLEKQLKPGTITQLTIDVLEDVETKEDELNVNSGDENGNS